MTDAEAGHDRPVAQAWGFFALTYLWSWSSWGLAIASGAEWTDLPAVLFYVVGGFGPSCVAVLLVYLGRAGEAPSRVTTSAACQRSERERRSVR